MTLKEAALANLKPKNGGQAAAPQQPKHPTTAQPYPNAKPRPPMGEPATARLTEPDISVYNKSRSEQWPITIVLVNGQSITGPVSRFGRYTVAVRVGDVIRMVYKTSIAYIEFSTEVNFRGYGFVTEATVLEQAAI